MLLVRVIELLDFRLVIFCVSGVQCLLIVVLVLLLLVGVTKLKKMIILGHLKK